MKTITINKDEVYKIKGGSTEEENFFFDTYKRCIDVVRDICRENSNGNAEDNHAKQGYGRLANVLLITGSRGTGKTSTLCTVSDLLKEGSKYSKKLMGNDMTDGFYVVKGIIDPSAMTRKESIIRVFLSRLYADYIAERDDRCSSNKKGVNNAQKILELFEECYKNLESLSNSSLSGAYDQDELDNLASMGDSSKIVENLDLLIKELLEFFKSENGHEYNYMVIRIDDMDLAAGNVYKLIDDIRNYLSLSKLIILMAVDFNQMEIAVKNEYIKRYKEMIKLKSRIANNREENEATEIIRHCNVQAGRYIEKAFPEGHCVSVPKLDEELRNGVDGITLKYYDGDQEKKIKGNPDTVIGQLLSLIYDKTGIFLVPETEGSRRFFPTTLRELTHFARLLFDMKTDIDNEYTKWYSFDAYFQALYKNDSEDLANIRDNLKRFTEYFCNYWCMDRLDSTWSNKIRDYLRENEVSDAPHFKNMDANLSIKEHETIVAAISISKTLKYNRTMIESWAKNSERSGVFEQIMNLSDYKTFDDSEDDNLLAFKINLETLKDDIKNSDSTQGEMPFDVWIEQMCYVRWSDNADRNLGIAKNILMDGIKEIRFDLSGAFLILFKNIDLEKGEGALLMTSQVEDDLNKDTQINDPRNESEKNKSRSTLEYNALCETRDVVVNQECYNRYIKMMRELKRTEFKDYKKWGEIVKTVKSQVDNAVSIIRGDKRSSLGEYISFILNNEKWVYMLFRNNEMTRRFLEEQVVDMLKRLRIRIITIKQMEPINVFYQEYWDEEKGINLFFGTMQEDIQNKEYELLFIDKNKKIEVMDPIDRAILVVAKANVEIKEFGRGVEKIQNSKRTKKDTKITRIQEQIDRKAKDWNSIINEIDLIINDIKERQNSNI